MTDDLAGDAVDAWSALSSREKDIVGQCLRAAAAGPFFDAWEFQTLMGVSREDVRRIASVRQESLIDDEDEWVVRNVLNNLLGYPHEQQAAWRSQIVVGPGVVSGILAKISD